MSSWKGSTHAILEGNVLTSAAAVRHWEKSASQIQVQPLPAPQAIQTQGVKLGYILHTAYSLRAAWCSVRKWGIYPCPQYGIELCHLLLNAAQLKTLTSTEATNIEFPQPMSFRESYITRQITNHLSQDLVQMPNSTWPQTGWTSLVPKVWSLNLSDFLGICSLEFGELSLHVLCCPGFEETLLVNWGRVYELIQLSWIEVRGCSIILLLVVTLFYIALNSLKRVFIYMISLGSFSPPNNCEKIMHQWNCR